MRIVNTGEMRPNRPLSDNERDWVYNGLDCCVTLEIRDALLPQLDEVTSKTYAFSQALQAPILEMSARGTLVDQRERRKVLELYRQQIARVSFNLDRIVGEGIGFDVNTKPVKGKPTYWWRSPIKVKNLFYDVMELPSAKKKNANGVFAPTVNREAIEKLSNYYIAEPVCAHLLTLRDLDKKRSFLETGIDEDGRIRTNFNIAGTNTGRLASSMSDFGTGGNLQNVDRELRGVFVADPGYKFANLDLEQADSRNLGALCWNLFVEEFGEGFAGSYLDACESGDLHTRVSMMARPHLSWNLGDFSDPTIRKFNRAIADTKFHRNDSYRDLDKKLGHGSNYLGQPATMSKHAHVPVLEVQAFQANYFSAFPCISEYHKFVRRELAERASLTTLFGRRRQFFGRPTEDATIREAVAFSPQSMTADEIDTGILLLHRAHRIQLLIQVHDSILFQYPAELEDEIIPWALNLLRIPLVLAKGRDFVVPTEAKIGWNWGEFDEKKNPDGLIKWKGSDTRSRMGDPHNVRLSLSDY